jgi:hypothetical protein
MTARNLAATIEGDFMPHMHEVAGKVRRNDFRGGTVCGDSDAHASYVKPRPVSTSDICVTIYQCLGIDPKMPIYDNGRPIPVAHGGQPIHDILAQLRLGEKITSSNSVVSRVACDELFCFPRFH